MQHHRLVYLSGPNREDIVIFVIGPVFVGPGFVGPVFVRIVFVRIVFVVKEAVKEVVQLLKFVVGWGLHCSHVEWHGSMHRAGREDT